MRAENVFGLRSGTTTASSSTAAGPAAAIFTMAYSSCAERTSSHAKYV